MRWAEARERFRLCCGYCRQKNAGTRVHCTSTWFYWHSYNSRFDSLTLYLFSSALLLSFGIWIWHTAHSICDGIGIKDIWVDFLAVRQLKWYTIQWTNSPSFATQFLYGRLHMKHNKLCGTMYGMVGSYLKLAATYAMPFRNRSGIHPVERYRQWKSFVSVSFRRSASHPCWCSRCLLQHFKCQTVGIFIAICLC